jgi:hypothetical protein
MRHGAIGDRLIALFLLGVVLLTPPMMAIFNVDRLVFGIPLLYLYLFGAWILLVGLVALVLRPRRTDDPGSPPAAGGP